MALTARLDLAQRQRLAVSPQLRQSLAILRLPTAALAEEIAREAAENPFLTVADPGTGSSAYDYALATTAATESLVESLHRQIALQRLGSVEQAAALYLVGELREDGYLDQPLGELADATGLPRAILEAGLAALQRCEPAGIGARTLAECLELQLAEAGLERSLARAVALRIDDFALERWARLGRELGLAPAELTRISGLLRGLSSAPVRDDRDMVAMIVPELVVETGPQGQISVVPVHSAFPRLGVLDARRDTLDTDALRALYDRASLMARGVAARSETLLRIGRFIATTQSAFFLGSHDTIRPVTRAEAAAALSMHGSTLGRALAGKALMAGNRVYPLSHFFSRALNGPDGRVSPFDVQRRMRELIAAESADAPLADEVICAQLRREGVDIARRTVAKYRKCMRIPSSFGRKRRKVSTQNQPRTVHKNDKIS
ncbi:hypothetical protein OEZ60_09105 [Defluviimonas sp. WL0024]|uniref:RNA polymerase sigma-54 factor n=1 Tax=Albidovulum salinarum TaxID=2984153 RepID=A0ABT2X3G6_9RHOB|nr:hypothetical protein [Defluviimonas sp. WL0024]MCU9848165.1 hypothetical protein [Defluviimonas sp. WL0024]